MNRPDSAVLPTKINPVALCLRSHSGQARLVPLVPSPIADSQRSRIGFEIISPTDYWLVRSEGTRWGLRMNDPEKGSFEVDLPEGLVELVIEVAHEHSAPPPRRRKRADPPPATLIGLLASSVGSQLFIDPEPSRCSSTMDLGTVCLASEFALQFDGGARRWKLRVTTIGRGRISALLPENVNASLSEVLDQPARGPRAS